MAQPTKPWPEIQHELGGARVYYLNQSQWKSGVKDFAVQMIGSPLNFNVTDEVRKANENFRVPTEVNL